jgi:hypothetical protein
VFFHIPGHFQPTFLPFGFCKTMLNSETFMLKGLKFVHANTPSNHSIPFKAYVITISPMYIWVLDSCDTLNVYLSDKIAR